jgi:hypothetical protein
LAIVRRWHFRKIDGFVFESFKHKFRVAFDLHPGVPEEAVVICAMPAFWIADACYGNEPVRGQFLNKPDHMAAGTMKLFGENLKRWPGIAFTAREIGKIGIEFLGLFRDFGTLLKPLRQPHAMKQAMRIDEFRSVATELLCYVFCYGTT